MTNDIALVLAILGIAIVLFATEKIRVDLISMFVLLSLILTGLLTPEEAFSGFSNPAVITVWAIYIISEGLFVTGVAPSFACNDVWGNEGPAYQGVGDPTGRDGNFAASEEGLAALRRLLPGGQ